MHHFLNGHAQALQELAAASKLTFHDQKLGEEKSTNHGAH
jgi:hypothetical protein